MRPRLLAAALLAAGGVQACATPQPPAYAPLSDTVRFGYRDRPNPDGGHTLLVAMPASVAPPNARAYWDRRAGELCPDGVAKSNVFRSERRELMTQAAYVYGSVGVGSRIATGYEIEGYVYCTSAPTAP